MMNKNMRKLDIEEVKKRIDNGLIIVRRHPFLDLRIFNYTNRTQHERLWDSYTRMCRGLIVDGQNNILNNPFPKFYNLGETEETMIQNLPCEVPSITEKLDGMLGILYEEGDDVAISTRGAFDSPYAEWATNWLRLQGFEMDDFKKGYTYLFEIIYPQNKILVDYGDRAELTLIAVRNNCNDHELNHIKEAKELGLSYAQEFSSDDVRGTDKISGALKYLEKFKGTEHEGFVCRYSNGLRLKIKSADYKRLQKILIGLSAKDIWATLRDMGTVEHILENVPDEFYDWIKKIESDVTASKNDVINRSAKIAEDAKKLGSRIEQAEYITNNTKDGNEGLRGVAFFLLDGRIKKAEYSAWQRVRPSGEIFRTNQGDL
jgi:RNA ligase